MTDKLTYQDILALDAARTQGDWLYHDAVYSNESGAWGLPCIGEPASITIPEHFDDEGNDDNTTIYLRKAANAQYIAAMPQAVEMLKRLADGIREAHDSFEAGYHDAAEIIITELQQLLQEEQKG